jgi:hypothetical protein
METGGANSTVDGSMPCTKSESRRLPPSWSSAATSSPSVLKRYRCKAPRRSASPEKRTTCVKMWRTSAGAGGAAAATAAAGVVCVAGGQVRTPTRVPTATLTRTTFVHIGADTADPTGGLIGTGLALIGGAAGIGVERTYGCVGIDALIVWRGRTEVRRDYSKAILNRGAHAPRCRTTKRIILPNRHWK